jgi:FkbM family methyltransferase
VNDANPYRILAYPNGYVSEWIAGKFPDGYRGHAIDVGASDGYSVNSTYTLERSNKWTVLSVEANPRYKAMLNRHRAWVEICACGESPAEAATFYVNHFQPEAYSALRVSGRPRIFAGGKSVESPTPTKWETITVPVRTVDQLLDKWQFPKLDLICIDTEGTEHDVLLGCDLKRWRPRWIVVESWEEGAEEEYLKGFGYVRTARCAHNDIYRLEDA